METTENIDKTVPVPGRVKAVFVIAAMLLTTASVGIGMVNAPSEDIPVMLSDGEVIMPPYHITVDGREVVLVESREAACKVIDEVIDKYSYDREDILDIQIQEKTEIKKMELSGGDEPPNIMTVKEARDELLSGSSGEAYLTVVVTREETEREPIDYDEEYRPSRDMYIGEKRIAEEGEEGIKETVKKVVTKNGKTVETEILTEETIREPIEQVTLTGTKTSDALGGDCESVDRNVSYDEDAAYGMLETPVPNVCITSHFGPRWGRIHCGVDLALPTGSDIYAAEGGRVYHAGSSGGYGNLVKIDHGNGMQTYYAHLSSILVSEGEEVQRGRKIALAGSTGNSTGPHLHFEVIINGVRVNPLDFLDLE